MKPLLRLLRRSGPPVVLAGLLAGAWRGWHQAAAGFPRAALASVRDTLWLVLFAYAVWLVLFALAEAGLRALRMPERRALWLASAAAALPLVGWAGLELERRQGIRPSDLLEAWALRANAGLLAGALVLWAAWTWQVGRWRRAEKPPAPASLAVAVAVVLALEGAGAWAWRTPPGGKAKPDVLVVLIDALRADELGCYGYGRDTTPAIDTLARDAVVFRQAISQSTFTKTSIASLFTGRNPYRHGVYWGSRERPGAITADLLRDDETTLAEALRPAGYLTEAWVQNSHLRSYFGFAQGFVDYRDQQGSAARIVARFRRWLRGPGRSEPYFAYLHLIDLHDPYRPEAPYDTMFGGSSAVYAGVDFRRWGAWLEAVRKGEVPLSHDDVAALRGLYDGQLRAVDDQLRGLFDDLRAAGLYDDTLVIVTADHGDAFLEHGRISHSSTPYEELVRVPLIVKLPGGRDAGRSVADQVRLVDVMPTVLEVAGLGRRRRALGLDGCDLLDRLAGVEPEPRCRDAVTEIAMDEGAPVLALRDGRYKLIHFAEAPDELYDLAEDPGETRNLAADLDTLPAAAQELGERLRALVALRRVEAGEETALDEATIRQLEALGYIAD